MNRIILKLAVFYGGMLCLVVALFAATARYGEAHLKAADRIQGRYQITYSSLPDCLSPKSVVLEIQQSGVYVNGFFASTKGGDQELRSSEKRPSLTGRWHRGSIQFSGQIDSPDRVGQPPKKNNCTSPFPQTVQLEGIVTGKRLQGWVELGNPPIRVNFSALQLAPEASQPRH